MAKCNVKVIGMADRVKGKSKKSGKDFDFCNVAFSYDDPWDNACVCCAILNGSDLDEYGVSVGKEYVASIMEARDTGKIYVDLISEVRS